MPDPVNQTDFTPPQIAKMVGATPDTIIHHIRSGELEAYNLGTAKRPRWRVTQESYNRFRQLRSNKPTKPKQTAVVRKLV